jgi:hypothetical protein
VVRTRVKQASPDLAAIDTWVVRAGGRVEEYQPHGTLAPYYGQPPIPMATLYVLPRAVFDE